MELANYSSCNDCCDKTTMMEGCASNVSYILYVDDTSIPAVLRYKNLSTGVESSIAPVGFILGSCADLLINGIEVIQGVSDPVIGSNAPSGSKLFYNTSTNKITQANVNGVWVAVTETSVTNGLTPIGTNSIGLGGALTQPTTITSSAVNPLKFASVGNAKVATFEGDIDVQGQIDPNSIAFSKGINSTYDADTEDGYALMPISAGEQRPVFVRPKTNSTKTFEVRGSNNTDKIYSVDTANKRNGFKTDAPNTTVDINGDFAVKHALNISTVGVINDLNIADVSAIRLTGATSTTITGFANGVDGKFIYLHNTSTVSHYLGNNTGTSIAANRINTGINNTFELKAGAACSLQYDATTQIWRVISGAGAGIDVLGTVQATPTPTGNTANLNTVFKDANGDTWVVDGNGDAILAASTTPPSVVVVDNTITDPTTIIDAGRYIVPAIGGTGVFVGQANKYADFDGTRWTFVTPDNLDRVQINTGPNAGGIYAYNGTTWNPVTTTINDFWRSGAGATTLPDGTTDLTEAIRRNGLVGLNADALSTFDDNGSFALAITNVAAGNYTAATTDSVIYLNSATTQTLTLPAATGVNRRIYTISNPSSINKVITSYLGLDGIASTVIPAKSVLEIQSDGTSWKTIGLNTSNGVSSVPVIVAKGRVDIGDPIPAGARTVTNGVNIASATGLDSAATDARLQVNFSSALTSADYIISGELVSQNAANWGSDNEIVWTVVSKTITGFVISTRELSILVTESLFFDFQVHQAGVNTSTAYVAGSGISITGNTIAATPSVLSGNIIAIGEKYPSLTEITFGNFRMRWNAPSDRYEIATVAGTEVIEWTTMSMYGGQSTVINGGGGMDATTEGTPITATTTFQIIGDAGILGIENRTYNIWSQTTGKHYRVNVLRKGFTFTSGWSTFVVEEIGITSSQILTAGNGISIIGNVVSETITSGDVLQTRLFSGTNAFNWDNAAFTVRSVAMPSFTPKSTSSKIAIELDAHYVIGGTGTDEWQIQILEGATLLYEKRQRVNIAGGGSGRSAILLPLMAVIDNTVLTARTFNIRVARVTGDDSIAFFNYRSLKFTEVQN